MSTAAMSYEDLAKENDQLRQRLEEVEPLVELIRNGEVDAVVVYATPSERVYTLEEADRPYRLLVEAMQQPVGILTSEGAILYCNPSLTKLLQSHEECTGALVESFVLDEDKRIWTALMKGISQGTRQGEVRFKRNNTESIPVAVSINPLPFRSAVCVLITDLTQQKQYEQLLQAQTLQKELEEKLRLTDRRKDEFLATLAHELRNPLAPIRSGLQVLQLTADADVQERTFAMMDRQIVQMVRLVDDLLDLSRVAQGVFDLRKEKVNLATVIDSALEISRPLIEASKHQLSISIQPEPMMVWGDPSRLSQVVSNLLNNAAKYTPAPGHIWLTARREGDKASIRVRDNGIGIPTEMLPRVFEMYMQGERVLNRAHVGLGIGLTLVKRLLETHDGTVEVTSQGAGMGSEFVVTLPLLKQEPLSPEDLLKRSQSHKLSESGQTDVRRRILVVDDSRDAAESLTLLLEAMGNQVQAAHDGVSALQMAKEFRPQVVLLDIGMPGMSGYEVCRKLREMPETKDVVVVAQSGWGDDEDRRRSLETGFDYHLVKPIDSGSLRGLLNSLVNLTR
jgi:PAS domain S-box-containing protein